MTQKELNIVLNENVYKNHLSETQYPLSVGIEIVAWFIFINQT